MEFIWLIKLLLAHLLTDFVLQPKSWIEQRKAKHFAAGKLYLHGLVTGIVALMFMGPEYWAIAIIIMLSHTLIDAWKSYQEDGIVLFILDQVLHILVILLCWVFTFHVIDSLLNWFYTVSLTIHFWVMIAAMTFLTTPAGILIGQLTSQWRKRIADGESLANAGKWIGIVERLIVFILVMLGQFSAISLLVAAKGIIRFNEKDRAEVKTEYLVIGTLMSIAISMITGLLVKMVH